MTSLPSMLRIDDVFGLVIAAGIALALLLASLRIWRHARRRRVALLLLQWPCALLLLAALLVHDRDTVETLVMDTPGAPAAAHDGVPADAVHLALPGADTETRVQRVPDLATALRQHPAVARIVVRGDGLAEHDVAAVGTRELVVADSVAPTAPELADLDIPHDITAGAWWTLAGRIAGPPGTRVELLDPSGASASVGIPDADGRFSLQALARAAGTSAFSLRVLSGESIVQQLDIPIEARLPPPLRVLLLAAAPSPELKYLRRWALDAGVDLASRIDAAPGLGLRRGENRLDAATLAGIDLLVLDERSWPQADAQRRVLRDAIAGGLGVLVRITGPVPARVADDLRTYGFDPSFDGDAPVDVRVDPRFVPLQPISDAGAQVDASTNASAHAEPPGTTNVAEEDATTALHAWPLSRIDQDIPALLNDSAGRAIAPRIDHGLGRIALWPLNDTWRLVTRGAPESHAALWAHAWSSLARARATPLLQVPSLAVVDQRATLCGDGIVRVVAPDGGTTTLLRDLHSGCAAFWPTQAGWHRVEAVAANGEDDEGAQSNAASAVPAMRSFHVATPDAMASIERERRRSATAAYAARSTAVASDGETVTAGVPVIAADTLRALLLAAWLLCMTLAWWLERRAGRGGDMAPD